VRAKLNFRPPFLPFLNEMAFPPEINKKEEVLVTINKILRAADKIDTNIFYQEVEKSIQADISPTEIFKTMLLTATSFLEKDLVYDKLASNFLLRQIYWEVFTDISPTKSIYQQLFTNNIVILVEKNILDKRLLEFDLEKLSQSLAWKRDEMFNYLGLETLAGRYLLRRDNVLYETPQFF
jgi:hypothetical protein